MTESLLISREEMGEVNGEDVKLVSEEMESESKPKRTVKGLEMFWLLLINTKDLLIAI